MSMIYTGTDIVERIAKILSGDYPTAAMRARIWLFIKDIMSQLSDQNYECFKTSSNMSVGSNTQTVDLPIEFYKPIQIYTLSAGTRVDIRMVSDTEWNERATTTMMDTYPTMCRIYGQDTDKYRQLQIYPMFSAATSLYYDYYRYPTELSEYQTGTATIHIGSAIAVGTTTQWLSLCSNKSYFRIDSVGKWYQISSLMTESTMTITPAYITATQATKAYTISNILELPEQGALALIYGVASQMLNVSGQKELGAGYWQMYQDALARLKASETKRDDIPVKDIYVDNSITTGTHIIESIGRIISSNPLTYATRYKIWTQVRDLYSQMTDRLYNNYKTSSTMSIDSATQIVDLPVDFMKPIQVYTISSPGGSRINIQIIGDSEWGKQTSTTNTAQYPSICRIYGQDTDKNKQLEISPMFTSASTIYIDYYKLEAGLTEYQVGAATTTLNSQGVTGIKTQWVDFAASKYYLRIDSDGKWYQINSVTSDTALVLKSPGYLTATKYSAPYTISNIVQLPEQGILALIYGGAAQMLSVSGQKEIAAGYYQLYENSMNRLIGSESSLTETMKNCYTA